MKRKPTPSAMSRSGNPAKPKPGASNVAPAGAQVKFMEGFARHQSGQLARAQELYQQVLRSQPAHFDALHLLGVIAYQTKNPLEAVDLIAKAIAIDPENAAAHNNHGTALQALKRFDEALDSYDRALGIKPDYAEALNNRGNVLRELKRLDEALASYDGALRVKPYYAPALNNRGMVLQDLKRSDEALDSYDRALSVEPLYAGALSNRGNVLADMRRLHEALDSYDRALEIEPDFADAFENRGDVLRDLKRFNEALASYRCALQVDPENAEVLADCGRVLEELKRLDEAMVSYDRALEIKPDIDFLYGDRLHAKMKLGDWSDAENELSELLQRVQRGEKAIPPFNLIAYTSSLALQRKAAEIFVSDFESARPGVPVSNYPRHERIRIGYYSADYHNHAMMVVMAGLFEQHNREKFEIVALSFGPDANDEMRKRVSVAFDKFIDVRDRSDRDIALLSRDLEIDIAVDLNGLTRDMRVGIFLYGAAPLQVNYLGYPGTMGTECIDYLIADDTLIPRASQQYYAEKIVYLPNSYQVNDRMRPIADTTFTREELGLPSVGFVFCCFNSSYKISPRTFRCWMRILKEVEGSLLWLVEGHCAAVENFRNLAEQSGVDAKRLVFAKRVPLPEYLARYRLADLFLDTLPYNAHSTASDALWAGLPVLTCTGEAFASRVAASVLHAIDLPELITANQEQYEALAVDLATNPERLRQVKQKLERNRLTTPLFDSQLFAKCLEDAYTQMYERHQAGFPPDHIYVEP